MTDTKQIGVMLDRDKYLSCREGLSLLDFQSILAAKWQCLFVLIKIGSKIDKNGQK